MVVAHLPRVCKICRVAPRPLRQSYCRDCDCKRKREAYAANAETERAKARERWQANREAQLRRARRYYAATSEERIAYRRAYYEANREAVLEKQRAYYRAQAERAAGLRFRTNGDMLPDTYDDAPAGLLISRLSGSSFAIFPSWFERKGPKRIEPQKKRRTA